MKKFLNLCLVICIIFSFSNKLSAQSNKGTENESITAAIAGIISGSIARGRLLASDSIGCTNDDYKIISFEMNWLKEVDGEKTHCTISGKDNKFTAIMLNEMKEIKVGEKIYFENIKAKPKKGKKIDLPSVILKVN